LKSMTAYGSSEYEFEQGFLTVELKALNNRYKDIILRLPSALQEYEDLIRSEISSKIKRGRIEVSMQLESNEGPSCNLELNRPLMEAYLKIYDEMNDEFKTDERLKPDFFLQLRDAVIYKPVVLDPEKSKTAIGILMKKALDSFDAMRLKEGEAIGRDLKNRLDLLKGYLDKIEERAPSVVAEYREKLQNRIVAISEDIEIDENRLAQEVAIFAGRCDITEEIVRARSHLDQFNNYMEIDDAIGRRLDFLVQELNREINTISSKASDSLISANAVDAKAALEKIREQIQNVE
jgi:uncharacterized protein (TIGR00255 family)